MPPTDRAQRRAALPAALRHVERRRDIFSVCADPRAQPMSDHGATRLGDAHGTPIAFTWNGRSLTGVPGDTLASALIAAGERVFTTHPTSGEARGGFCMVGRCADCLVVVDCQPGVMACVTPLTDGLRVARQAGHGHWGEVDS